MRNVEEKFPKISQLLFQRQTKKDCSVIIIIQDMLSLRSTFVNREKNIERSQCRKIFRYILYTYNEQIHWIVTQTKSLF